MIKSRSSGSNLTLSKDTQSAEFGAGSYHSRLLGNPYEVATALKIVCISKVSVMADYHKHYLNLKGQHIARIFPQPSARMIYDPVREQGVPERQRLTLNGLSFDHHCWWNQFIANLLHLSKLGHSDYKKWRRDAWNFTSKCLIRILQRDVGHLPKAVRSNFLIFTILEVMMEEWYFRQRQIAQPALGRLSDLFSLLRELSSFLVFSTHQRLRVVSYRHYLQRKLDLISAYNVLLRNV